jgi:hypothetical protein
MIRYLYYLYGTKGKTPPKEKNTPVNTTLTAPQKGVYTKIAVLFPDYNQEKNIFWRFFLTGFMQ